MDPVALLIVSCQIFHLHASLQAPQLTVEPKGVFYMTGQSVALTCSHGYGKAKKFIFFKDKTELNSSGWTSNHRESYRIPQLSISDSGEYSCKYCMTSKNQPIHSSESSPARITVVEWPPLPFFSISPKQEIYTSEEVINLICSVSDTRKVSKIQFLKNKTELASFEHSPSPFTYSLDLLAEGGGNYSCRYWVEESEGEIPSQESNVISISVTDPPPRPVLKLDPSTGEVKEGARLLLTCSTDRTNTEKRFRFSRDGIEMTSANEGLFWSPREPGNTSTTASVTILHARPSQTGEFACRYEEKNSSSWISSPWSQKVNITVLAKLPKVPLEYAAFAIPLLILMVLLVVYCMRKKKESDSTESKEEIHLNCLGTLRPREKAIQKREGSEVTYADLRFYSANTPSKPLMRNKLEPVEEEMVVYGRVHFQPTSRATK